MLGTRHAEVADVWRAVWPQTTEERLADILPRHAGRDGFRFVGALDGSMVGFAYGYLGAPGQWWHDHVSAAMNAGQRARWLAPGHFEFVELAVLPEYRRRGIGGRLHDALLDGLASRTAVLTTQVDNEPALALYRGRGWRILVERVDFGDDGPPYLLMGLDLTQE